MFYGYARNCPGEGGFFLWLPPNKWEEKNHLPHDKMSSLHPTPHIHAWDITNIHNSHHKIAIYIYKYPSLAQNKSIIYVQHEQNPLIHLRYITTKIPIYDIMDINATCWYSQGILYMLQQVPIVVDYCILIMNKIKLFFSGRAYKMLMSEDVGYIFFKCQLVKGL